MPSGNGIVEKTAGGIYYGATAITYGLFGSSTSIMVGIANSGTTALASTALLTTPGMPATLTSVDVNGDGKPDLIVVSDDTDTAAAIVSVFLGNGDGTYQPRTDYTTQLDTGYVTVADVNKDGHPDLIVAGFPLSVYASDPAVEVFLNNGGSTGTFGSAINGPALPDFTAQAAAVADFNKDGNPDIATNDGHILLGDGTGHFSLMAGSQFVAAGNLVAADFNGDGKWDIATVSAATGDNYQETVGFSLATATEPSRRGIATPISSGSATSASAISTATAIRISSWDSRIRSAPGPLRDRAATVYFLLGRGDELLPAQRRMTRRLPLRSARPSRWRTSTATAYPNRDDDQRVGTFALHAHWQWRRSLRAGRDQGHHRHQRGCESATGSRRAADQRH